MDIRRIFGSVPQEEVSRVEEQKTQTATQPPIKSPGLAAVNDSLEKLSASSPITVLPKLPPGANVLGLPDIERMPFFQANAETLTTAPLAMILNYVGFTVTPEELNKALGFEASPQTMLEFAYDKGFEAEGYNNGTIGELKSFIEKGIPVMAVIEDSNGIGSQYVAVTGFGIDNTKTPPEEYVTYRDGYTTGSGPDKRMPLAEFEKRWAEGRPEPIGPGYENFFMAFAPPDTDLPAGRDEGIEAIGAFGTGATNMMNGFSNLWTGDGSRIHGLVGGLGGTAQAAIGGLGWLFCSGPAQWLNDKVEGFPVLENIVQPLAGLWDTAGAVIGDLANAVGALTDNWGKALGCLAEGDFTGFSVSFADGLVDAGSAVADAVVDTVSGVVDAVGDFFSGW